MDYTAFYARLDQLGAGRLSAALEPRIAKALDVAAHGDLPRWCAALAALPVFQGLDRELNADAVAVTGESLPLSRQLALESALQQFHPWRKGPFAIHGVQIDSEWRSDWKWRRLEGAITPLQGRRVLDVGSGNGYFCWRMAGQGAALALGIDSTLLCSVQFQVIRHFLGDSAAWVVPINFDDFPADLLAFDTLFSMGVLYHRRNPLAHLQELQRCLRPDGELVLETLVLDQAGDFALCPHDRYAQMRNVWFIPTPQTLCNWLVRSGYREVNLVDVSPTCPEEQRSTPWMRFHSLTDFLDPQDLRKTLEGYPAPARALVVARAP